MSEAMGAGARFVLDHAAMTRLTEVACESIRSFLAGWNECVDGKAGSHIEKMFHMALDTFTTHIALRRNKPPLEFVVTPQALVAGHRVDFLITTPGGRLAVECDGHEFHESTKRQVARDRSRDRTMQVAGYTVFRFTGHEIWTDPYRCAQQVWCWICDTQRASSRST